jgi:hypothetical protein
MAGSLPYPGIMHQLLRYASKLHVEIGYIIDILVRSPKFAGTALSI